MNNYTNSQIIRQTGNHNVASNNNSGIVSTDFTEMKNEIEGMRGLTRSDKEDIMNKIDEMEKEFKSNRNRDDKWERMNKIIKWVADKSVDVGIAFLSRIINM